MTDDNHIFLPAGGAKKNVPALTVDYRVLGTISIDELFHAIHEDLQALKDIHGIQFVTGARLKLPLADQYGQRVTVRRDNGAPVYLMHTYHHRPACKDYDL